VGNKELGEFRDFQQGKWIETDIPAAMTNDGRLPIRAKTIQGNAVISIIEWGEREKGVRMIFRCR
jgi:hypothetical protein